MKNGLGKKVWPVLLFNGMRKILAWLLNLDGILGMLLMNTCSIVSSFFVCTLHDISPARQTQTQPGFNIINFSLHGYLNEIDVWVGIHLIIDLQYYLFKRQGLYRKKICLHHRTGQALSNCLILLKYKFFSSIPHRHPFSVLGNILDLIP